VYPYLQQGLSDAFWYSLPQNKTTKSILYAVTRIPSGNVDSRPGPRKGEGENWI
jgi:hypothetical protein